MLSFCSALPGYTQRITDRAYVNKNSRLIPSLNTSSIIHPRQNWSMASVMNVDPPFANRATNPKQYLSI